MADRSEGKKGKIATRCRAEHLLGPLYVLGALHLWPPSPSQQPRKVGATSISKGLSLGMRPYRTASGISGFPKT